MQKQKLREASVSYSYKLPRQRKIRTNTLWCNGVDDISAIDNLKKDVEKLKGKCNYFKILGDIQVYDIFLKNRGDGIEIVTRPVFPNSNDNLIIYNL